MSIAHSNNNIDKDKADNNALIKQYVEEGNLKDLQSFFQTKQNYDINALHEFDRFPQSLASVLTYAAYTARPDIVKELQIHGGQGIYKNKPIDQIAVLDSSIQEKIKKIDDLNKTRKQELQNANLFLYEKYNTLNIYPFDKEEVNIAYNNLPITTPITKRDIAAKFLEIHDAKQSLQDLTLKLNNAKENYQILQDKSQNSISAKILDLEAKKEQIKQKSPDQQANLAVIESKISYLSGLAVASQSSNPNQKPLIIANDETSRREYIAYLNAENQQNLNSAQVHITELSKQINRHKIKINQNIDFLNQNLTLLQKEKKQIEIEEYNAAMKKTKTQKMDYQGLIEEKQTLIKSIKAVLNYGKDENTISQINALQEELHKLQSQKQLIEPTSNYQESIIPSKESTIANISTNDNIDSLTSESNEYTLDPALEQMRLKNYLIDSQEKKEKVHNTINNYGIICEKLSDILEQQSQAYKSSKNNKQRSDAFDKVHDTKGQLEKYENKIILLQEQLEQINIEEQELKLQIQKNEALIQSESDRSSPINTESTRSASTISDISDSASTVSYDSQHEKIDQTYDNKINSFEFCDYTELDLLKQKSQSTLNSSQSTQNLKQNPKHQSPSQLKSNEQNLHTNTPKTKSKERGVGPN